jgi:hypothetical protein
MLGLQCAARGQWLKRSQDIRRLIMTRFLHAIAMSLLIGATLVPAIFHAQMAAADEDNNPRTVHFATESGLNFYAGDVVTVTDSSADDVFGAAGAINVFGVSAPSIIVAGGSVTLSNISAEDVIAAGGNVEISGTIRDDLIAAGGRVSLQRGTTVSEDAILSGGQVTMNGDVGGELIVNGGNAVLGGLVAGNVTVNAASITILPGARIDGDLTYSSQAEIDLPGEAVVRGTVTRTMWRGWSAGFASDVGAGSVTAIVGIWFASLVGLIVLAVGITAMFPRSLSRIAETVRGSLFQSLGIGIAALFLIPATAFFLFFTLVGSLLGIFVIVCFLILLASALVAGCLWIGFEVRRRSRHAGTELTTRGRLGWAAVGVLIFKLVGILPFVGTVAQALVVITGLGGIAYTAWTDRQAATT